MTGWGSQHDGNTVETAQDPNPESMRPYMDIGVWNYE